MDKKPRIIIFDELARKKMLKGVKLAADTITATMGSKGGNVAIELNWGMPLTVHDGVTVAKNIWLADPFENMGAQMVLEAAKKTNDSAGDGTTTASLLSYAILKEGFKNVSAGMNAQTLRKGIDKAVKVVISELKKKSIKVESKDQLIQIASISAADKKIGELIAKAVEKVGESGVVTVQEGRGFDITVDYKEGMEFDHGYVTPYCMNTEQFTAEYEGKLAENFPYIVLVDEKLTNENMVAIHTKINAYDQDAIVLFLANDFEPEAIQTINQSRMKTQLPVVIVKSPDFGDHRTQILTDIAVLTNAKVLGENGAQISSFTPDMAGRLQKFLVSREHTVLIGGVGEKKTIEARILALKKLRAEAKSDAEMDKLDGRIAKLIGGVAVISVGAPSEMEMREIKERVIDAVNATQAAISEGIVPGGGVALVKCIGAVDELIRDELEGEERIGAQIVKDAITYPLLKLVDNSGHKNSGYVLGQIKENADPNVGYNVDTEQMENLVETGIIDPVKVTRSALINAASVANMMLTTWFMIAYDRVREGSNGNESFMVAGDPVQ